MAGPPKSGDEWRGRGYRVVLFLVVFHTRARDVGYTLPAAFLQKYRRFEATAFKDVNTMVKGPQLDQFALPGARALRHLPPKMAEAMQRLCKPAAKGGVATAPTLRRSHTT